MHINFLSRAAGLLVITLVSAFAVSAQVAERSSYDATLYLLSSSVSDAPRGDIPPAISSTAKRIAGEFGTRQLRLVTSLRSRVATSGTNETKFVSSAFGGDQQYPSFLEWTISDLSLTGNKASIESFRFGARIPIKQMVQSGERSSELVNYEQNGMTMRRLSVVSGEPVFLGTLATPKADETLFVILKIDPAL